MFCPCCSLRILRGLGFLLASLRGPEEDDDFVIINRCFSRETFHTLFEFAVRDVGHCVCSLLGLPPTQDDGTSNGSD